MTKMTVRLDLLRNLGTTGRMVGFRAFMSAVRVFRFPENHSEAPSS